MITESKVKSLAKSIMSVAKGNHPEIKIASNMVFLQMICKELFSMTFEEAKEVIFNASNSKTKTPTDRVGHILLKYGNHHFFARDNKITNTVSEEEYLHLVKTGVRHLHLPYFSNTPTIEAGLFVAGVFNVFKQVSIFEHLCTNGHLAFNVFNHSQSKCTLKLNDSDKPEYHWIYGFENNPVYEHNAYELKRFIECSCRFAESETDHLEKIAISDESIINATFENGSWWISQGDIKIRVNIEINHD